jgi:hypothetical protein
MTTSTLSSTKWPKPNGEAEKTLRRRGQRGSEERVEASTKKSFTRLALVHRHRNATNHAMERHKRRLDSFHARDLSKRKECRTFDVLRAAARPVTPKSRPRESSVELNTEKQMISCDSRLSYSAFDLGSHCNCCFMLIEYRTHSWQEPE